MHSLKYSERLKMTIPLSVSLFLACNIIFTDFLKYILKYYFEAKQELE